VNGVDVFRIFDAMNDVRNLATAIKATKAVEGHAQGTMSYTVSPVHTLQTWLDMAKRLEDMGSDSLCIKDMAGLLRPQVAFELITALKQTVDIPIAMQCHATTGLSTATYQKAIEAGIDILDTAISSMSMTYGHTATETVVAMTEGTDRDSGLDLTAMQPIADHFREVRKNYAQFEGSLKGIDARILTAQVPGGMLTNMENQLREQGALDKFDEVLAEIPRVREDLGFIPLVTPTSQIVGTQAVLNVLTGKRYSSLSKETRGVLRGEYGATAAAVNKELQQQVLQGDQPITVRPADLLAAELDDLTAALAQHAKKQQFKLADAVIDDVLIYALFPQIGLKFLQHRGDPNAFEQAPTAVTTAPPAAPAPAPALSAAPPKVEHYDVKVDGVLYQVEVGPSHSLSIQSSDTAKPATKAVASTGSSAAVDVTAPLAGNVFKVLVKAGQRVQAGEVVMILEAMKMETDIKAQQSGAVTQIHVREGDSVGVGDVMLSVAG
jgi:oxaloacetate decarboxylase alpha subunit